MQPNDLEEMAEKTLASGETVTMARYKNGYDVDCWDKDGNNRWHRFFLAESDALHEYERWS
jgi:hypothetical protein